jgi:glycosyltransferase involved in cell wall biosynthesis
VKVLLLSTTDQHGGAAIAAHRLLTGLNKLGIDAKMLVLNKYSSDSNILKVEDYLNRNRIYRIKVYFKRKLSFYCKAFRWYKYPHRLNISLHDISISYIEDCLKRIDFEILHLHWIEGGFVNFKELQNLNKPIIWTIHGSFPFTGICHHLICENYLNHCGNCKALNSNKDKDLSFRVFKQKQKRYADLDLHIISPSKYMANKAGSSHLLGNRPIRVIPNAIDSNKYAPVNKTKARSALNIPIKKTIAFGAISSISDKNKGFSLLLEGIYLLNKYYQPDQIQLLIFGDEYKEELGFSVINFGKVENDNLMKLIYSSADIMVVPSKHENLPYTIMESLSCETPVVAFNIGGNSEMVEHKKNGYLAEPYNIEDLTYGIRWCLENNRENLLGKYGRLKIVDEFDEKIIVQRHVELYQCLISNKVNE